MLWDLHIQGPPHRRQEAPSHPDPPPGETEYCFLALLPVMEITGKTNACLLLSGSVCIDQRRGGGNGVLF